MCTHPQQVSMHTTSQLPEDLQQIKKHMGLPLVKFESPIFLDGFYKAHLLDSPSGVVNTLIKYYKKVKVMMSLLHHLTDAPSL